MHRTSPSTRAKADKELNQDPRRLRRRRFAAKLTLRDAADKAGCSFGHLSDLENGKCSARVTMLVALADAYECEVTDLMPVEAVA